MITRVICVFTVPSVECVHVCIVYTVFSINVFLLFVNWECNVLRWLLEYSCASLWSNPYHRPSYVPEYAMLVAMQISHDYKNMYIKLPSYINGLICMYCSALFIAVMSILVMLFCISDLMSEKCVCLRMCTIWKCNVRRWLELLQYTDLYSMWFHSPYSIHQN